MLSRPDGHFRGQIYILAKGETSPGIKDAIVANDSPPQDTQSPRRSYLEPRIDFDPFAYLDPQAAERELSREMKGQYGGEHNKNSDGVFEKWPEFLEKYFHSFHLLHHLSFRVS